MESAVPAALGFACEAFLKQRLTTIFGSHVFEASKEKEHYDLDPGVNSPTGKMGEIKLAKSKSIYWTTKKAQADKQADKYLCLGCTFNYSGPPKEMDVDGNHDLGELDLALNTSSTKSTHQILMTYDPFQQVSALKWPIFVTNTPAQIANFAKHLWVNPDGTKGMFDWKMRLKITSEAQWTHMQKCFPTLDGSDHATTHMLTHDFGDVLAYITSSDDVDTAIPASLDLMKCHKCKKRFKTIRAANGHRANGYC